MRQQYIYFLRPIDAEGPIKIGCSAEPERRLKSFMQWSPVPLEIIARAPGDISLERTVHSHFEDSRSHSEWFRPTDKLTRFIGKINSGASIERALRAGQPRKRHVAESSFIENSSDRIIKKFGGPVEMARQTGIPQTTISYWRQHGHVPQKRWDELQRLAKKRGVDLTRAELAGVDTAA